MPKVLYIGFVNFFQRDQYCLLLYVLILHWIEKFSGINLFNSNAIDSALILELITLALNWT